MWYIKVPIGLEALLQGPVHCPVLGLGASLALPTESDAALRCQSQEASTAVILGRPRSLQDDPSSSVVARGFSEQAGVRRCPPWRSVVPNGWSQRPGRPGWRAPSSPVSKGPRASRRGI